MFNIDLHAVLLGFTTTPDIEHHTCNIRCNAKCPMYDPVKALSRGYETNWPECARCSGHSDADGNRWIRFANMCGTSEGKPAFYSIDCKAPLCYECFMEYFSEGDTWPPGEDPGDDYEAECTTRQYLAFHRIGEPYKDIVDSWREPDFSPEDEEFAPSRNATEAAWMGGMADDEIVETDDCCYCGGGGCRECNNAIRRDYRERYPRGYLDEIDEAEPEWLGALYVPEPRRIAKRLRMPLQAVAMAS
jgi:hypothetical protein